MNILQILKESDPVISNFINSEKNRQETHLELIASENFASTAVMQAQGSVLTNKYAEGLPQKRYYGGCEFVDEIEELAIQRAKKLFNANWANVQPHSGAQANAAVFLSLLKPGDTIMGMDLSHGGHLTHGSPVNMSGKWFNAVHYGVDKETNKLPDLTEWTLAANGFRFKWKAQITERVEKSKLKWKSIGGLPTEGSVVFESKTDQITTVNLAITYELPKMIARFMEENILGKMVTNELQANIDRFKDLVEKNYSKKFSN